MLKLDRQEHLRERYRQMKPGYRPSLDVYRHLLASLVGEETHLLDAGCGPGGLVSEYVGKAALVAGVDRYAASFSEPAEIANLTESDLTDLPFADDHFDVVTCSWVLEHLDQPAAVFAEIRRVLKPDGHFLFITPNAINYVVWIRRLIPNTISKPIVRAVYGRNEDFINPTYYRANTYRTLDSQLTAAGFAQVQFDIIGDPTYLAINEIMFRASVTIEGLLDRYWSQGKVHLVGLYQKKESS